MSYSVQNINKEKRNCFLSDLFPPFTRRKETKTKHKIGSMKALCLFFSLLLLSLLRAAPLPLRSRGRGDEARHAPPAAPGAGRDPPRDEPLLPLLAASSSSFSFLGHLARKRRGRLRQQIQSHERQDRGEVDRAPQRGDDPAEQVQVRVGQRRERGDDRLRRLRPPREEEPPHDRGIVEGQERRDPGGEDDLGRGVARDQSGEACVRGGGAGGRREGKGAVFRFRFRFFLWLEG